MGFPAARVADSTVHGPPLLGKSAMKVLIGGKPAWRVGDVHTCPMVNAPPPAGPGTPHATGTTMPPGALTVLIENMPAARMGDMVMEPAALVPLPPPNPIISGCFTVLIGGPAPPLVQNPDGTWTATYCPGLQITGDPTFIGHTWQALDRLKSTPSGNAMINSISNSGQTVTINESTSGNTEKPANWNDGLFDTANNKPGPGTDTTVKFNPNRTKLNGENWMTRDPAVGLGHELIHADHDMNGTSDGRNSVNYTDLNGNTRNAPGYELQAVGLGQYSNNDFTENKLRSELGEVNRPRY